MAVGDEVICSCCGLTLIVDWDGSRDGKVLTGSYATQPDPERNRQAEPVQAKAGESLWSLYRGSS